ncbi:ParM/StbA family protein [Bacillus cereus group sp. Bc252]|uniref:ParM/StbA family protein n=1 Tax=Bacillus cereus group TaxID=86661 RepID=UPI0021CE5CC8|nr:MULTISPECIES: ParM/StbA family protein [Bacillus cereus group]MCU5208910.1 ParM/StbA family protein [Bacillus paranthracis]MDA2163820.1 ParM/StbA family protein [Bacillus cereus group sp. Bc252]HDR7790898.1 ParM/StbA family protein [Bacillus paranthracis]
MKITIMNKDFGNSLDMNLIDGFYIEIPTNVVEISKDEADSHFVATITNPKELLSRLLISTTMPGEDTERFFLVGDEAAKHALANNHVNKLHDKITSPIPYVMFLSAVSFYHAINEQHESDDNIIEIEYFQTMLPIWLLKRTAKFSEAQNAMAERFAREHEVTIHTPGMEKTLKITVGKATCRIEGEIARLAIKKDFELEDREEARQFDNNDTVLVDIGGGTIDLVLSPAGLKPPKNRDSMQPIDKLSYLSHIEKLRKEKFLEKFSDLRSFETFIVNNFQKPKMELVDGNTGQRVDLTEKIRSSLKEFAKFIILKIQDVMPAPADKVYKYVYFGGVTPILESSIHEVIEEMYGAEIAQANHIFLPDSRKLNLYGLEVKSRGEILQKKEK